MEVDKYLSKRQCPSSVVGRSAGENSEDNHWEHQFSSE